jgi:hypothetical protein
MCLRAQRLPLRRSWRREEVEEGREWRGRERVKETVAQRVAWLERAGVEERGMED